MLYISLHKEIGFICYIVFSIVLVATKKVLKSMVDFLVHYALLDWGGGIIAN